MTAQVFTPQPRYYDYDKDRDLETAYAVGAGLNEYLSDLADEQLSGLHVMLSTALVSMRWLLLRSLSARGSL